MMTSIGIFVFFALLGLVRAQNITICGCTNGTRIVAFSAHRKNHFTALNSYISYDYTDVNIGQGLDLASGIFTAPVKGLYYFFFSGMKRNESKGSWWNADSATRMTVKLVFHPSKAAIAKGHVSSRDPYTWAPATFQAIVSLNQGDKVAVNLDEGSIYDPDSLLTTFSGHLLFPLQ